MKHHDLISLPIIQPILTFLMFLLCGKLYVYHWMPLYHWYPPVLRPLKKKKERKKEKKKPCFTGGQIFQVGSVGRDISFFFLVAKMTPLKKHKHFQKICLDWRKLLNNYSSYFKKIIHHFFLDFG